MMEQWSRRLVVTLATLTALMVSPTTSHAAAMWDTADVWSCDIKLHLKIKTDGTGLKTNELSAKIIYDFAKLQVKSTLTDTTGKITRKFHVAGRRNSFNYIEIDWQNFGLYPGIITQTGDEYWDTSASGHASPDKEIWISNFRCTPA